MKTRIVFVLFAFVIAGCTAAPTPVPLTPTPEPTATLVPKAMVPSVMFMSPENATARLQEAKLRAEKIEEKVEACASNNVLSQAPGAGTEIEAGSVVKIFVCVGPTPTPPATATPRATATPAATNTPVLLGPARRLNNGALVKQDPILKTKAGDNRLIANNRCGLDSVIVVSFENTPILAVYIRGGESFTYDGIWRGVYDFFYVCGEDWDSTQVQFMRKVQYGRTNSVFDFSQTTRQFTIWTLTYVLPSNSSWARSIDAAQFPNLK